MATRLTEIMKASTRTLAPASGKLGAALCALAFSAAGCGGGNAPASSPAFVEVAPPPAEESATPPASDQAASPEPTPVECEALLRVVRERGLRVAYVIAEDTAATLRIWPSSEGDSASLGYHYELRDERGREAGEERYQCTAAGLLLVESGPPERRIGFEPPLPVLPLNASAGSAAGRATLTGPEGTQTWGYRFAFDAADVPAAGPLAHHEGRRRNVRSVLMFDDSPHVWSSDTTWLVAEDALFVTRREQIVEDDAGIVTWTEEARSLSDPR